MKLKLIIPIATLVTLSSVLTTQSPSYARTWLCRTTGVGCPQSIPGTSPNPPKPPEPLGFQVCNNSPTNLIDVAYVTKKIGSFGTNGQGANTITTVQGWWNLRSGQCQVIYQGNASDVVAVYGQGGGKLWGNSSQYCIHPTNGFSFGNEVVRSNSLCVSRGGRIVPFFSTGNSSRFFTFTFTSS
jgi:uncharacterized membrane protein